MLTNEAHWVDCFNAANNLMGAALKRNAEVQNGINVDGLSLLIDGPTFYGGMFKTFDECGQAFGLTAISDNPVGILGKMLIALYDHQTDQGLAHDTQQVYDECIQNGALESIWDYLLVLIGNAWDPNLKMGPGANSVAHYMNDFEDWNYNIYFENDSAAGLSAQTIVLVDTLDTSKFDLSTFRFTSVTLGEHVISLPSPHLSFLRNINLINEYGIIARVTGQLDTLNGVVTWTMRTIDPGTGQVTTDPAAGFLPPDTIPPIGQGNVGFSVRLQPEVTHLDSVSNLATIIFDYNPPMPTPTWTCVVDTIKPNSNVLPLPENSLSSTFLVDWQGNDDFSGVQGYRVKVSTNGGSWQSWISSSDTTAALFEGQPGNTYAFYTLAIDSAGNVEDPPVLADATTYLPVGFGEPVGDNAIVVRPNPTADDVFISSIRGPGITRVTVRDAVGRIVQQKTCAGRSLSLVIALGQEPSGMYTMDIDLGDGTRTVRTVAKQ